MEGQKPDFKSFLYNQVSLVIAAVSLAFGIYFMFANPQRETDNVVAQMKAEFTSHEKAQEERNANMEKYFYNLQNGDLKDILSKIESTNAALNALTVSVGKLETKVDERIPKK